MSNQLLTYPQIRDGDSNGMEAFSPGVEGGFFGCRVSS